MWLKAGPSWQLSQPQFTALEQASFFASASQEGRKVLNPEQCVPRSRLPQVKYEAGLTLLLAAAGEVASYKLQKGIRKSEMGL